jgi:hypothetical protein
MSVTLKRPGKLANLARPGSNDPGPDWDSSVDQLDMLANMPGA